MEPTKDRIEKEADDYAFQIPYDGSKDFYNSVRYESYIAGATVWSDRAQQELQVYRDIIKELVNILDFTVKENNLHLHHMDIEIMNKARKLIDTVTPT